jgi:signal transduction histidine kinase
VSSRRSDECALAISVSDTGMGVQPAEEQKIYDMFFTTKPKGTGMGLPISRSIVESHGGRLWVTRNEPRGAVFQFTIAIDYGVHSGAPRNSQHRIGPPAGS